MRFRIGIALAILMLVPILVSGTDGLLAYGEEDNNPRYRLAVDGIIGIEQNASSVGGQANWVRLASKPGADEIVLITLDEVNDVNVQVWNGDTWGDESELTDASRKDYQAIAVDYESQSGHALAAYADMTGTNPEDFIPRYNIWNGSEWSSQGFASSIGARANAMVLASNPDEDELILVTTDATGDINAQVWDGNAWGNATELTTDSFINGVPFAVAYESLSASGLIVYTSKEGANASIRYRTVSSGAIGSEQFGPELESYGKMYRLVSDPESDEIVLLVMDQDKDTRVIVWDGNSWSDLGEVSDDAPGQNWMSLAGAYQSTSGDAILSYSDGTSETKYRIWNGSSLSNESSLPEGQNKARWMDMAADPESNEVLLVSNTAQMHIDAYIWNGSAWNKTPITEERDTTSMKGGVAAAYEKAPSQICGNNVTEGTEVCDGTDLNGQTCSLQGFDGGTLACAVTCDAFETTACFTNTCDDTDNGTDPVTPGTASGQFEGANYSLSDTCVNSSELTEFQCSTELATNTSIDCSLVNGSIGCLAGACVFPVCGNNVTEGSEVCDGTDIGNESCISQGFDGGTLGCQLGCGGFDTSGCFVNTCSDSDGGNEPFVPGNVNGSNTGSPFNNTDTCLNASHQREWTCVSSEPVSQDVDCDALTINPTICVPEFGSCIEQG